MKEIIKRSFKKNIATYNDNAHIQKLICKQLAKLICEQKTIFNSVYEIGAGTGLLTSMLLKKLSINEYHINDLVDDVQQLIEAVFLKSNCKSWHFQAYDAENIFPPTQFDLITSASTLQWFTDIDTFLNRIADNLCGDGIFAFNTFGKSNLKECRALSGKGLKFYNMSQIHEMLSKNYTIIDSFEEIVKLKFNTPINVLQHLQKTGVNALKGELWTKSRLSKFEQEYIHHYSYQDGVALTYHPQYFIVKKR